jgi:hypothetical protein
MRPEINRFANNLTSPVRLVLSIHTSSGMQLSAA